MPYDICKKDKLRQPVATSIRIRPAAPRVSHLWIIQTLLDLAPHPPKPTAKDEMHLTHWVSLVGAFPFLAWKAAAGPYSAYDVTTLIPFEDQTDPTWNDKVHVYMRIGSASGTLLRPWIDTGSTGVVLPASLVPGFNQNKCNSFNEGYHYLTSSNILYLGCWLPQDLYFNTETDFPVVHAQVPVFAVHTKVECAAGTEDVDVIRTGTCTGTSTANPTGFWFVGIGWAALMTGNPRERRTRTR
jgi:hypothetical protein